MTKELELLLVEDSIVDAEIVERHVKKAGFNFRIRRVETEAEMLSALSECEPALIISDFSLPRFDGLQALQIAATHAPQVPFIFVSGTIGEERAIDALRKGATDYILKTNLSRLSPAIERALRETSMAAAKRESERQRREQEMRLERLTRSYRMLSSTGSAMLRLQSRGELLEEICRIAHQQGGYQRVVISLIDTNANSLCPRISAGVDSEALRARELIYLDAEYPAQVARLLNAGDPVVINDLTDGTGRGGREVWLAQGWRAVAALPLRVDGTWIGTITLYSSQQHVFDEAEVGVLLELTANVCFALQYLDKNEALQFLSFYDGLTGLAKRQLFCQRLASLLAGEAAGRGSHAVLVFDVQKLGSINDSLGRYVGDRLIEQIAARIKRSEDSDQAGYLGGGTFALVFPEAPDVSGDDRAREVSLRAARLIGEPFHIAEQELRPSLRCGVAVYPADARSAEALVQAAEAALKAAREDNEKCVMYDAVTRRPTSRSVAMEARLTAALDNEEFLLHYQPKVHLGTGEITGLEALLRWRDKESGLVSPAIFVPLLERSGAILDVGEWVIRQAVRDIRLWEESGVRSPRVAVNVSPLQLRRHDFVLGVLSSIEPLGGRGIDIEITESVLMQDIELSIRKLSQLREAGIGVAIDDFGTGYSSLRLLGRLPVDVLKIDRSFIQGITETPRAMTLVETIISLARAFEMHTVAEGVETVHQMRLLNEVKCDQVQGFYLSRPVPAADVPALIARLTRPEAELGRNLASSAASRADCR